MTVPATAPGWPTRDTGWNWAWQNNATRRPPTTTPTSSTTTTRPPTGSGSSVGRVHRQRGLRGRSGRRRRAPASLRDPSRELRQRHAAFLADIQKFANWFTYYRKRALMLGGAMGKVLEGINGLNVGVVQFNDRKNVTMYDLDSNTNAQRVAGIFYGNPRSGGTPHPRNPEVHRRAIQAHRRGRRQGQQDHPVRLPAQQRLPGDRRLLQRPDHGRARPASRAAPGAPATPMRRSRTTRWPTSRWATTRSTRAPTCPPAACPRATPRATTPTPTPTCT